MSESSGEKVRALWRLARYDPVCCEIRERYMEQERDFSEMTAHLSEADQDIAWGFVCTSDELDHRLMEVMCEWFDLDPIEYLRVLENERGKISPWTLPEGNAWD